VETLSKLQAVARIGGHEFQGLTQMMADAIRNMASATEQGRRSADAFEVLGVKTRDSAGKLRDTGQILIDVSRALQRYGTQGEQVAIIQDALGTSAAKYLPFLKDIAEEGDLAVRV